MAVSGDFGAPPPMIARALSYDPDQADGVLSAGDVISISFAQPTDRAGLPLLTPLAREMIDRLFVLTPPLSANATFVALWADDSTLNLTLSSTGLTPELESTWAVPTSIACVCAAPTNQTGHSGVPHCRDPSGIHFAHAHLSQAGELSCPSLPVAFDPGSSWGTRPGPALARVIAADPDDNDAIYSSNDTLTLVFDGPTNLGGYALGERLSKPEVDGLFTFSPSLGADYTAVWTDAASLTILIMDATGHGLTGIPGLTWSTGGMVIRCRPESGTPIRDADLRNLPSSCVSMPPFEGSFGELLPPPLAAAVATDADGTDGILSSGDTIALEWGRETDCAGACVDCAATFPVPMPTSALTRLLSFRQTPDAPSAPPPPPLPLDFTGVWTDCRTLTVTLSATPTVASPPEASGRVPSPYLCLADGLEAVLCSQCASDVGVRNRNSNSLPSTGSIAVSGSVGDAAGPALAAAVADDADNGDAVPSPGDTLTLTFDGPTDLGGFEVGTPLPSAWLDALLLAPPAPPGAWSGAWTDARTIRLTLTSGAAGIENVPAWSATNGTAPLSPLTATVGIVPHADIRDANRTSLPSASSVGLSGDWGALPGPAVASLVASGGADDARYSDGDQLALRFGAATDRGGTPIGTSLSQTALDASLSCSLLPPLPYPGLAPPPPAPPLPFPLAHFGSLRATWLDDSTLRLSVVSAALATPDLLVPPFAGGTHALDGRLQCCVLPTALIRTADAASLPSTACSPPLSGDWGVRPGPMPLTVNISNPKQGGASLGVGDIISLEFDGPTDRGGVPIGWAVPYAVLEAGLAWSRRLYVDAEGRWVTPSVLHITILELAPDAPTAVAELCPAEPYRWLTLTVKPPLSVRDPLRSTQPSAGTVALMPDGCAPGSGPGLYGAGNGASGALGVTAPSAGATTCTVTSVVAELQPVASTEAMAFTQLAAGDEFSVALDSNGGVHAWGVPGWGGVRIGAAVGGADERLITAAPSAVELPDGARALAVAAGRAHFLVLLEDGRVVALGSRQRGQTGHGIAAGSSGAGGGASGQPSVFPAESAFPYSASWSNTSLVPGLQGGAYLVAAGAYHSLIVTNRTGGGSELFTFGENDGAQLGRTTDTADDAAAVRAVPPGWLPAQRRIVHLAGGRLHSLVALDSGAVCAWGANTHSQLGPLEGAPLLTTRSVGVAPCFQLTAEYDQTVGVASVAAGDEHSLALSNEGRLFSWGAAVGAIGSDRVEESGSTPRRPLEDGAFGPGRGAYVHTIAAGRRFSVATTTRGHVWAWGDNSLGQLGTGCGRADRAGAQRPSLALGLPVGVTHSWAIDEMRQPVGLTVIDAGAVMAASGDVELSSVPEPRAPHLYSVAGPAAGCRAACEAHADCVGFTFPRNASVAPNGTLSAAGELTPAGCTFYGPAQTAAAQPSQSVDLHRFETRERGGAAVAAGAAARTIVAIGLAQEARCPLSGSQREQCGGAERGRCSQGACVCEPGWSGEGCQVQACEPGCHPERGQCKGRPSTHCECFQDDMGRPLWSGDSCEELPCDRWPPVVGELCGGHGTCVAREREERGVARTDFVCVCDAGWNLGSGACESPSCSIAPLNDCSFQGSCECTDHAGGRLDECSGAATQRCNCKPGFTGVDCSTTCPNSPANGLQCSGYGQCTTDASAALPGFPSLLRCLCGPMRGGDHCELALCPGDPECGGDAQGTCDREAAGGASCTCAPGYHGPSCSLLSCPNDCSGYGSCRVPYPGATPRCDCVFGWTGDDCNTNSGMVSLMYSLSIGGGVLLLGVCVGGAIYWLRGSRQGRFVGPTDTYRRRQWSRASSQTGGGRYGYAVYTPKRVHVMPSTPGIVGGGGTRTRMPAPTPNAP